MDVDRDSAGVPPELFAMCRINDQTLAKDVSMSMLATRKTKMVMAGIAALALDISAMNAPAAARQKVSDHRASYSLSFVHPAVPTAEASEYRALSAVVGVGY